jgi:hypothetical protein
MLLWDDRWGYTFGLRKALAILFWCCIFGLICTALMLYHFYVGLPAWFLKAVAKP